MHVTCVSFQKHLRKYQVEKLNFNYHIKKKMWKVLHRVGVIRKPSKKISQNSFITICKSFVRLHLDYGDMLFGQPNKEGL